MWIASIWTIAVTLALLVFALATGIRIGAVICVLPLAAAWIGLAAPRSSGGLLVADVLLGAAAVLLLIGWFGLLYFPPLVVFLIATVIALQRSWSAAGRSNRVR
jgi:hypothetical protein